MQVKVVMKKGYIPKFNGAFEHFLLHTGGRAVIDEMEEKLSLTPAQCQPSKDALYRFGNTSAASTWCAYPPLLFPAPMLQITSQPLASCFQDVKTDTEDEGAYHCCLLVASHTFRCCGCLPATHLDSNRIVAASAWADCMVLSVKLIAHVAGAQVHPVQH